MAVYSDESIHIQSFPKENAEWSSDLDNALTKFMEFNNSVWRYKKDKGIALSQKIEATINASKNLEPIKEDLIAMHKIDKMLFSEIEEGTKIQDY